MRSRAAAVTAIASCAIVGWLVAGMIGLLIGALIGLLLVYIA